MASQVSSLNGGGVGQVVTLLLGMNNEAADVITGAEADEVFYGVVQGAARSLVEITARMCCSAWLSCVPMVFSAL